VRRPGFEATEPAAGFRWTEVEVPALDVSSSDLRARVAGGRPIDVLVPAPTATWIAEHRIYSRER
jgi:nicotinate-nucleotide adenylyltransferase